MSDCETFDVIVIGAGISGIYAAKFYLDIHPDCRLVVIERDICVGGTWNSRRVYESFWTQCTVGSLEFSDLPMPQPPEGDRYYEFFKAKHATRYLENYVDHHKYAGRSLRDRIKLSTEVQSVRKANGKWTLSMKERGGNGQHEWSTTKLIVASGLTSIPNVPTITGQDDFQGQIIHQESFGSSNILSSQDIQSVTVIGGGKSSADMAYDAAKAGKTVSWVLRATGTTGPSFLVSPKGKGPYKNAFQVATTRLAAFFTPSFMNGDSYMMRLLHSSKYGVKMIKAFWSAVDAEARRDANFERENLQGFEKLAPHSPVFWQNGPGGLLNQADFFDTMAQHVRVYCGDILCLKKDVLCLKDGEEIPTDALLCGTGWVPSLQFFTPEQHRELGLPHPFHDDDLEKDSKWAQLESAADAKVVTTFLQLAEPPPHYSRPSTVTPYRLYKHIAPLAETDGTEDRSIVFIGHIRVADHFLAVQSQVMWATAYLDWKLLLPSREEQMNDVALFVAWCRRRYLSYGQAGNNMTFELIGYMDSLLQQLGLSSHRKGYFKDLLLPNTASDYSLLKDEYIKKYGRDEPRCGDRGEECS